MTAPLKPKVDCLHCKGITRHQIVSKYVKHEVDELGKNSFDMYFILECLGCEHVSFAIYPVFTGDDENFELDESCELHKIAPDRSDRRERIGYSERLPERLRLVYEETVDALNARLRVVAAAGLRATVEAICNDKGAKAESLKRSIDLLAEKGLLALDQAEFLHMQRYLGNAAIHEIRPPEREELFVALDIVENLLRSMYVSKILAEKMKSALKKC